MTQNNYELILLKEAMLFLEGETSSRLSSLWSKAELPIFPFFFLLLLLFLSLFFPSSFFPPCFSWFLMAYSTPGMLSTEQARDQGCGEEQEEAMDPSLMGCQENEWKQQDRDGRCDQRSHARYGWLLEPGMGGKRRLNFTLNGGSFQWESDFAAGFCSMSRNFQGLRDSIQKREMLCSTDRAREGAPELEGRTFQKKQCRVLRESLEEGGTGPNVESTWTVVTGEGDTNSRYKLLLMKSGEVAFIMYVSNRRKWRIKEAKRFTQSHVATKWQSSGKNLDLSDSKANFPFIHQYSGGRDL